MINTENFGSGDNPDIPGDQITKAKSKSKSERRSTSKQKSEDATTKKHKKSQRSLSEHKKNKSEKVPGILERRDVVHEKYDGSGEKKEKFEKSESLIVLKEKKRKYTAVEEPKQYGGISKSSLKKPKSPSATTKSNLSRSVESLKCQSNLYKEGVRFDKNTKHGDYSHLHSARKSKINLRPKSGTSRSMSSDKEYLGREKRKREGSTVSTNKPRSESSSRYGYNSERMKIKIKTNEMIEADISDPVILNNLESEDRVRRKKDQVKSKKRANRSKDLDSITIICSPQESRKHSRQSEDTRHESMKRRSRGDKDQRQGKQVSSRERKKRHTTSNEKLEYKQSKRNESRSPDKKEKSFTEHKSRQSEKYSGNEPEKQEKHHRHEKHHHHKEKSRQREQSKHLIADKNFLSKVEDSRHSEAKEIRSSGRSANRRSGRSESRKSDSRQSDEARRCKKSERCESRHREETGFRQSGKPKVDYSKKHHEDLPKSQKTKEHEVVSDKKKKTSKPNKHSSITQMVEKVCYKYEVSKEEKPSPQLPQRPERIAKVDESLRGSLRALSKLSLLPKDREDLVEKQHPITNIKLSTRDKSKINIPQENKVNNKSNVELGERLNEKSKTPSVLINDKFLKVSNKEDVLLKGIQDLSVKELYLMENLKDYELKLNEQLLKKMKKKKKDIRCIEETSDHLRVSDVCTHVTNFPISRLPSVKEIFKISNLADYEKKYKEMQDKRRKKNMSSCISPYMGRKKLTKFSLQSKEGVKPNVDYAKKSSQWLENNYRKMLLNEGGGEDIVCNYGLVLENQHDESTHFEKGDGKISCHPTRNLRTSSKSKMGALEISNYVNELDKTCNYLKLCEKFHKDIREESKRLLQTLTENPNWKISVKDSSFQSIKKKPSVTSQDGLPSKNGQCIFKNSPKKPDPCDCIQNFNFKKEIEAIKLNKDSSKDLPWVSFKKDKKSTLEILPNTRTFDKNLIKNTGVFIKKRPDASKELLDQDRYIKRYISDGANSPASTSLLNINKTLSTSSFTLSMFEREKDLSEINNSSTANSGDLSFLKRCSISREIPEINILQRNNGSQITLDEPMSPWVQRSPTLERIISEIEDCPERDIDHASKLMRGCRFEKANKTFSEIEKSKNVLLSIISQVNYSEKHNSLVNKEKKSRVVFNNPIQDKLTAKERKYRDSLTCLRDISAIEHADFKHPIPRGHKQDLPCIVCSRSCVSIRTYENERSRGSSKKILKASLQSANTAFKCDLKAEERENGINTKLTISDPAKKSNILQIQFCGKLNINFNKDKIEVGSTGSSDNYEAIEKCPSILKEYKAEKVREKENILLTETVEARHEVEHKQNTVGISKKIVDDKTSSQDSTISHVFNKVEVKGKRDDVRSSSTTSKDSRVITSQTNRADLDLSMNDSNSPDVSIRIQSSSMQINQLSDAGVKAEISDIYSEEISGVMSKNAVENNAAKAFELNDKRSNCSSTSTDVLKIKKESVDIKSELTGNKFTTNDLNKNTSENEQKLLTKLLLKEDNGRNEPQLKSCIQSSKCTNDFMHNEKDNVSKLSMCPISNVDTAVQTAFSSCFNQEETCSYIIDACTSSTFECNTGMNLINSDLTLGTFSGSDMEKCRKSLSRHPGNDGAHNPSANSSINESGCSVGVTANSSQKVGSRSEGNSTQENYRKSFTKESGTNFNSIPFHPQNPGHGVFSKNGTRFSSNSSNEFTSNGCRNLLSESRIYTVQDSHECCKLNGRPNEVCQAKLSEDKKKLLLTESEEEAFKYLLLKGIGRVSNQDLSKNSEMRNETNHCSPNPKVLLTAIKSKLETFKSKTGDSNIGFERSCGNLVSSKTRKHPPQKPSGSYKRCRICSTCSCCPRAPTRSWEESNCGVHQAQGGTLPRATRCQCQSSNFIPHRRKPYENDLYLKSYDARHSKMFDDNSVRQIPGQCLRGKAQSHMEFQDFSRNSSVYFNMRKADCEGDKLDLSSNSTLKHQGSAPVGHGLRNCPNKPRDFKTAASCPEDKIYHEQAQWNDCCTRRDISSLLKMNRRENGSEIGRHPNSCELRQRDETIDQFRNYQSLCRNEGTRHNSQKVTGETGNQQYVNDNSKAENRQRFFQREDYGRSNLQRQIRPLNMNNSQDKDDLDDVEKYQADICKKKSSKKHKFSKQASKLWKSLFKKHKKFDPAILGYENIPPEEFISQKPKLQENKLKIKKWLKKISQSKSSDFQNVQEKLFKKLNKIMASEVTMPLQEVFDIIQKPQFHKDCHSYSGRTRFDRVNTSNYLSDDGHYIMITENLNVRGFLVSVGLKDDVAWEAQDNPELNGRLQSAITEARSWVSKITMSQGLLIYILAVMTPSEVNNYYLQIVEAIINHRISNVGTLLSVMMVLKRYERGKYGIKTVVSKNHLRDLVPKQISDSEKKHQENRARFLSIYNVAKRAAAKINKKIDKDSAGLLAILTSYYSPGLKPYLSLLAHYISQKIIFNKGQLTMAVSYLQSMSTRNFNQSYFESNCGLEQNKVVLKGATIKVSDMQEKIEKAQEEQMEKSEMGKGDKTQAEWVQRRRVKPLKESNEKMESDQSTLERKPSTMNLLEGNNTT